MPFTASQVWRAAKPIGAAASRIAGAALLAYAFILVLITASLQMSVTERLTNLQPALDYNSGYSLWQETVSNRKALAKLWKEEQELLGVIAVAERKERDVLEEWNSAIEPIIALQRRLDSIPGCESRFRPGNFEVNANTMIADLRSCVDGGNLSVSQRQSALEIITKWASIRQVQRETTNAIAERMRVYDHYAQTKQSISRLSKSTQARADATMAFRELNSFTHGRLIGSGLLGDFPPAVMHILLAFVSGMFGALLVTLVLVVYPQNELKLSTGGGGYAARIFLGGLISICVFVVLGGGTAVLGTSGGFGDGDANFLAFCSIGILAGMFSDRVAQWLSGRADAFFSRKGLDQSKPEPKPDPEPEPDQEEGPAKPLPS